MKSPKIEMLAKSFGLQLRHARIAKKLTIEDMATKIGVSVRTYGSLERGASNVALHTFLAATDILDVDLSDVITPSSSEKKKRVKRALTIQDEEVDF